MDGGFSVNIMMEELQKWLRLPNPKPSPNQLNLLRISESTFMGFPTLQCSQ